MHKIPDEAVKAMPERIYAVKQTEGSNCVVSFDTPSLDYNVEYVRADLAAPSPRAQALEEGALLNSAALIVEGRSTAINSEFIESLSNRKAWEVAEIIADHDIRLGSEIRALSSQPVDQEAKDFEAIGRAFMSCFEVITTELTEWFGYTPAECPSELVMDIFAAQQELKSSQPVADGWLPVTNGLNAIGFEIGDGYILKLSYDNLRQFEAAKEAIQLHIPASPDVSG